MPMDLALNSTMTYTSLGNFMPTLGFLFAVTIILGISISILSFNWFKKWFKLFNALGKSFTYFLKGCIVIICGLAIYGLYWLLSSLSEEGIFKPEYILYAILGYLGISGLGYLADRWYKRMKTYRNRLKK